MTSVKPVFASGKHRSSATHRAFASRISNHHQQQQHPQNQQNQQQLLQMSNSAHPYSPSSRLPASASTLAERSSTIAECSSTTHFTYSVPYTSDPLKAHAKTIDSQWKRTTYLSVLEPFPGNDFLFHNTSPNKTFSHTLPSHTHSSRNTPPSRNTLLGVFARQPVVSSLSVDLSPIEVSDTPSINPAMPLVDIDTLSICISICLPLY